MRHFSFLCLLGATSLFIASVGEAFAQIDANKANNQAHSATNSEAKRAKKNKFIRMTRDADGKPAALQTAITTYKAKSAFNSLRVDLVGAVHVGDKEYYQELNKRFAGYDVVLYELVAPKGTRIPKGGKKQSGGNPISMLQGMTKNMLNLASQMDEVDYTKANFVHADMSPAEMQATMKKRGDTALTVAMSAMAEVMRQSNLRAQQAADNNEPIQEFAADPFALLFDAQRDTKMKLMMAEQFAEMGTDMMGASINQLIVEDRNAAAMVEFQKQLAKGHKKIAIFYGAAHLPDFEERLQRDFDMHPTATNWVTAWDLKKPSKNEGKETDPLNSLLRTLLQPE